MNVRELSVLELGNAINYLKNSIKLVKNPSIKLGSYVYSAYAAACVSRARRRAMVLGGSYDSSRLVRELERQVNVCQLQLAKYHP